MDTAGLVAVLIGIYLLTAALKNRRPLELAKQIAANPARARELSQNATGYEPSDVGAPRLTVGPVNNSDGTTSAQNGNPTMALANAKPTGSRAEIGLKPAAKNGLRVIAAAFPQLKSFGGRGSRPIATSDHPRGLAVDFMIPGWNTAAGNALGWRVANYAKDHASELRVKYVIFNKKKWNPAGGAGWRPYRHPLGGGPTLAHDNHVHVSFKG